MIHINQQNTPINDIHFSSAHVFQPGDKLRAKHDLYDHIGTMGYNGLIYAGSRKFGRVSLVTLEQFRGGKALFNEGHVGPLSVHQIIARYQALLDRKYDLIFSNCEHTDNWARGLGWQSEQVDKVLLGILAGITIGALALISEKS